MNNVNASIAGIIRAHTAHVETLLVQSYIDALNRHDWHFEYSDDYSVVCRGRAERAKLVERQLVIDPHKVLWNRACPVEQRFNDLPASLRLQAD